MLHSSFWRGKQYQQLAELHLPGSSVVIDVRRGTDYDPPLIWNLSIELDDLSTEMELNQVYRWRYLTNCIDLLKLAPVDWEDPEKEMVDFVLTTRTGQPKSLLGRKSLIHELVTEHLDVVRTNRIGAGRDQSMAELDEAKIDPEHTTVRVFFLVDAEDTGSMISAAIYAKWLKSSYHEYEDFARTGRDKRISTLAVCMNADPHVHHAYALAESLNYASPDHPALDAVILLHTYSDDEAYIGGDIQSYQVEQILYTLLLISLESLSGSEQSVLGDQDLIPYTSEDAYTYQMPLLPWPIFMIGISSLEYSARWAGRWLDYGLVATIIDVMRAAEEVDAEDILDDLRKDVREKFDKWLQKVRRIVCEELIEAVANLQVFKELEYTLATSPFHGKKGSDSEHELGVFCQNIRRLYLNTGYGSTLESSMKSAELIPRQLERASMRMVQSQGDEEKVSLTYNLYQQLHELQSEVAKLPALLFQYVRGMLPRVSRQLSALVEMVNEVRETAESAPDLRKCLEQFNRVAERELLQLQRATNDQRWPFSGQITQLRKDSYSKLKDLVRDHMLQTRDVIVARIALVLLEKAGFYNSKGKEGKIDLFREKVRTIDSALKEAQKRAQLQKQRAYKRLNVSLSQTQVGISQTPLRLSLNNRRDRLDWTQVVESFEIHSKRLDESPHLELLMRWLLRLLGGEKPLDITQQYLNDLKTADPGAFRTDEQKQHELHAYSSMLVAVLILFATVGFDIVSIQNLLDKYTHLKRSAFDEPLTLETDIIGLQSIIREAKATRNAIGNKSQKQIFSGLASLQGRTLEIIIAAWVHNLYSEDPQLTQVLAQRGILARLEENQISPVQAIKDLQARNRLLGYRDDAAGSDLYYLLLAPGEASKDFLKEAAHIHFVHIQSIRFPDPEKLIYLHVHRVRQGFPGFIPPP